MRQVKKAQDFAYLHQPGTPVVLYNIWDAGGAKAVAEAGAKAIATGSWSVAAAHGYPDGQAIPMELVLQIVSRIAESVDLPVTLDFEGGYAEAPEEVAANVTHVISAGVVGINFEDQIVGGAGLYSSKTQRDRIGALRQAAQAVDVPLFINARTDVFLEESDRSKHEGLMDEAKDRGAVYAEAGASGFFVPGLVDPHLVGEICEAIALPVNVMMMDGAPSVPELASLGVARISYGPGPYFEAMTGLTDRFREISGNE